MNPNVVKKTLSILLLSFCLVGCSFQREQRRILVIHSYEETYGGYPKFNKLIRKQFEKESIHPDIKTVYLDCEAYREEAELANMRSLLNTALKGWTPEVILVNEDQATYTLLACNHPIVETIPVVFSGVNYPNREVLDKYPHVTGFRDRLDFISNVHVAKELFGDTIDIFSILDYTYLDRQIRSDIKEQIEGQKVVSFMDSTWKSHTQRRSMVRQEGYSRFLTIGVRMQQADQSLIWTPRAYSPNLCYLQLKRDKTSAKIGSLTGTPNITVINEAFGFGEKLLGGYITSLPIQVEESVGRAAQILRGSDPSQIPITDSRKEYVLDWEVLSELNIPFDSIPGKYSFINLPLQEKYPVAWILGLSLFSLALFALIAWLVLLYKREVQHRRSALRALADEKETLSLAFEGSSIYTWKFDNDRFILENAFWDANGVPPHNLSFEEVISIVHPDDRSSFIQNWEKEKVKRRFATMRCNFNGKGYEWWEFRYTTVQLPTGDFRTAGVALNIQKVKDREKELEEARRLAEKAELKQSFLTNMSHEIRTPLNAIVGFSNLLINDSGIEPEEKRVFIDTINRNNELLLKLINDILDLARIESGNVSFNLEVCPMNVLIDQVYAANREMIPTQLEYLKETDSTPVSIRVDVGRLIQVLSNFLNNACKFTEKGHIKLGYTYEADRKQVHIYVEDTGRGISPEQLKMIFSRFYKQDEFTQGTGLGLSICQVIVERLGGRIDVWSKPGVGSRFTAVLPCVEN